MLFNSIEYLIFFPLVVLIYYVIPKKYRYIWLLLASYYFYMCWSPEYAILIALSTVITYLSGLGLDKAKIPGGYRATLAKMIVILSCVSNLSILFFYKYFQWMIDNINNIFHSSLSIPFSILLPVGISFYTFQALSYTIDVYRGEIEAEKNIIRYALFVSFFPQLVAGPIERSANLLTQIDEIHEKRFDYQNVRSGLCLMIYGMFLKLVISDRAAIYVDNVFDHYSQCGFLELALAAVMFAIQILCDFNGYSTIAKGSAKVLNIDLMDNFKQPYLATSIKQFWRRWHISLTSWFTDYLYKPLGGSRKGIMRKMLNTMIVFGVSGLWHGASWHYVAWGILHGIFQNIGTVFDRFCNKNQVREMTILGKIARIVITFMITDIAWVFFRAESCSQAIGFFRQMFISFREQSLLEFGLRIHDWVILGMAVALLLIVDIMHENGIRFREKIFAMPIYFRWSVYMLAVWGVLIFGIYGVEYDASQFIYFQF
ncbi:MAG: MBOAT family protein [Lachnospiraceae bacterium]|nr:MBOAT family protein [Lachnospiraceae bacterium]